MTKKSKFSIENKTGGKLDFQIEPACWPFSLEIGEVADVSYDYGVEAPILQLTNDDQGGVVFVALIPSGNGFTVTKNGVDVLDAIT